MTEAGRLADRVCEQCARGESVGQTVAALTARVRQIESCLADSDLGRTSGPVIRELTHRLSAATAAAEAKWAALGTELDAIAQRDLLRRTYVRPPG
jgi:hypothetical protein